MIDLAPEHLKEVRRILSEHAPGIEVRAFGSRVRGAARAHSDLDLALLGEEKLDWRHIEALKDAFSESALPFQVDVLDWNAISESFRAVILERGFVLLQEKTSTAPPRHVRETCGSR